MKEEGLFRINLVSCEYVWVDKNIGDIPMDTDEWCLYYNTQVTAALQYEGRQILLEPNWIYLIPPHTKAHGTLLSSSFQLILFFLLPAFHLEIKAGIYKAPAIDIVIDGVNRLSSMTEKDRYGLIGQLYSSLLITYTLSRLDITLAQRAQIDHRIQNAVTYMNRFYTQNIAIGHMAKTRNMTREAFSRLFKKEMGRSPFDYISNLRMSKARLLLHSSTQPIKSVAQLVGYSDQYYFSRLFKKHHGLSPKAYRKSNPEE